VKVCWDREALADIRKVRAFVAKDSPAAAIRVADRIRQSARILETNPEAGVAVRGRSVQRWIEPVYGYVLVFQIRAEDGSVWILNIFHPRQNRPE